jgi:hypothetical protein
VLPGWPPRFFKGSRPPTWKDRRPVHGFRVTPGRSFNVVLGLAATAAPRGNASMVIYYHGASRSYVLKDRFEMTIAVGGRGCD